MAMAQAKASPVPALEPMFRVSPVLRRLPTAVPPTAVGACVGRLSVPQTRFPRCFLRYAHSVGVTECAYCKKKREERV